MKYTDKQYAEALYNALQETKDHDTVIDNFVAILKKNNELNRYTAIIAAYEILDAERRNITTATVTVAHETKISSGVMDFLNDLAKKKVNATTQVDESIIGGVVLRIDDTLIDASVKHELSNLKKDLSSN